MTKFKKLIIIFSVLLSLQILFTECATHVQHEYHITDFQLTDYAFSQAEEPWINYPLEEDAIDANSYYGFKLDLIPEIVNTVDVSQLNIQLIQNSYATAKSTEEYVLINEMKSISIITKYDFDSLHPANSDMLNLFNIYQWAVNDTLVSLGEGFIPFYEDYKGNQNPYKKASLRTLLTKKPQGSGKMQFQVQIHFADHSVLVRETPLIWQH